jgi:glutamine synthetase
MKPYVTEYFAENVFTDSAMRAYLSAEAYSALRRTIDEGAPMTIELADQVAAAMREWAVGLGATHYTHWFQPMTGQTAEKHDAFLSPGKEPGKVILDFDGKKLIRGEADASSFPSGGLRATFEARGYTTWDCTSPPFVRKDGDVAILCIPTAFCSYSGEALDEKTPLLRSMEALDRQAVRVLRLLGVSAKRVLPCVGGEQEYFLIDKSMYSRRKDLIYAGRTLFGAPPAKGQELEDQYYSSMSARVAKFMADLNQELWRLGVVAKTQHYEAAPAQYELAPMYATANIATDHNQIIMEMLRKVADRHGFACLLHEKPFDHVNGSGKHDNWSLVTDTGRNLLKPAKRPEDADVFNTFFMAVIAAVNEYAPALRMSCATLSNSYRLGGHEAPPAVISVYIGSDLCALVDHLAEKQTGSLAKKKEMTIGVSTLPMLLRDTSDRNRTSPFAFTGNKFEFRMVGSSQSLGFPNTVLNTIVAEQLMRIADKLESGDSLKDILADLAAKSRRVLFNGDNYTAEWREEAKRRGLPCIDSTVSAIEMMTAPELVDVFTRRGVLSETELAARKEIALMSYAKHGSIEATTMLKMSRQKILPACIRYSKVLADSATAVKSLGCDDSVHEELLKNLCAAIRSFKNAVDELEKAQQEYCGKNCSASIAARYVEDVIKPAMAQVRKRADELEMMVDKQFWPLPSYGEMMFCN